MTNLLLFDESEEESKKAVSILKSKGFEFESIEVGKNGFRRSLWRDFRTFEVPTLVADNKIFIGLEEIKKYVRKSSRRFQ